LHGDIEVAGLAAALSGVPLPGDADALAVGHTGRNAHRHRLGARLVPGSCARLARPRTLLAAAAAAGTAAREDHVAAHRPHRSRPLAHETRARADAGHAGAGAGAARLAARDRHGALRAVERGLERERERVVEVDAALGSGPLLAARREDLGEQIAKGRGVVAAAAGEVEPLEPARAAPVAAGDRRSRVVARAPLGIDQRLVGLENLPEAGFRRPVTRVDVRVIPPGEAP